MVVEVTRRSASSYEQAMRQCPDARRLEFRLPLELARPQAGEVLVDFPGGGGYLDPWLKDMSPDTRYRVVEHVPGYEGSGREELLKGDWDRLPFLAESVDIVLTLAALHHVLGDRAPFYRECRRVLGDRGRLIVADVAEGTPAARFLDAFVDQYSSEGHRARFMSEERERADLARCGFRVSHFQVHAFYWFFPDEKTAARFAKGLFRLDQASEEEVWQGLNDYLGVERCGGELAMNWQLALIRADRS